MPNYLTIGILQAQLQGGDDRPNIDKITDLIKQAHSQGAQVILPSELFSNIYFCQEERDQFFAWAHPVQDHPLLTHFQQLAESLGVVLPISFYERDNNHYYNSLALIDRDGGILGVYRKSHIPDGPGYEEKFYFRPGNTGFRVWHTAFGKIGVGICWDQWFPECARAMTLMGADVLLYPTAIGSEPHDPDLDTRPLWQRAMVGHAVCNVIPVAAANRVGQEGNQFFYGHSFICDQWGEILCQLGADQEGVLVEKFDLDLIRKHRASFGFFRDRRPDLYGILCES